MDETSKSSTEQDEVEGFPVLRTNVAGIDLGSKSHWVCAPTVDGQGREVKEFGATTAELEKMVAWLQERKVVSVAMESTGVYWIPPQEVLERHGLEVVLVDARELARVPGRRKTDRLDCKWIQRLHSCGLLRGSFRPKEQINMLRTLVRDKGTLDAWPDSTSRLASPMRSASSPETPRPVRIRSSAWLCPINRGSRMVPRSINGTPKRRQ